MGTNEPLKHEAVAALEAGGLLAFGVSEKGHGADLLANEFVVREAGPGRYLASGSKYYIGNANVAAMISILRDRKTIDPPAAPGERRRPCSHCGPASRPALETCERFALLASAAASWAHST